jgi:predicted Zn-dependent protease
LFGARGLTLAAAAAAGLAACIQDDGTRFNPLKKIVPSVSEDDEREIGMAFDRELQAVVPVIHDPVVADFINELGQTLVSQIEPQPFIYHFRIIDDSALNAFAVPGGYIYFHSGTVLAVSSVDELAGVMGHEIAHIKQHHYARMRKQSQIPDLLVAIAGMAAAVAAKEPGLLVATQAANVAMKLRYSREYEAEADQYGGVFMVRAGYDPAGSARFFTRRSETASPRSRSQRNLCGPRGSPTPPSRGRCRSSRRGWRSWSMRIDPAFPAPPRSSTTRGRIRRSRRPWRWPKRATETRPWSGSVKPRP